MIIRKTKETIVKNIASVASALLLGLVMIGALAPRTGETSAAGGTPPVWVGAPSISIAVPDNDPGVPGNQFDIGMVEPGSSSISSKDLTTTVTTNNPSGYTLDARMKDANQCMRHSSRSGNACSGITNTYKINPVPIGTATGSFPSNSWGVSTDPFATWQPIPASGATPLVFKNANTATSPSGEQTNLRFGIKVDMSVAAGDYSATVVVTALAKELPVVNIASVSPGTVNRSDTITLTGTNLNHLYSLTVGDVACENVLIESATTATCVIGATTPIGSNRPLGSVLSVYGEAGTTSATVNVVLPPPVVTAISPNTGHFRGGETLTITGTGFTGATAIRLGTRGCTSFTVVSDTQATCVSQGIDPSFLDATTPAFSASNSATNPVANWTKPNLMANAANTASVNVTTPGGTNTANTLFTYRYQALSYTQKGSYLYVLGNDFQLGSKIVVGGTVCKNTVVTSSTTAVCTDTPTLTAGSKAVTVQAPPAPVYQFQSQAVSTALPTFTCAALPTPTFHIDWQYDWSPYTTVVRDTRDSKSYRVRKMPDGRCWMIDNLALSTATRITAADTDIDTDAGADFVAVWNSLNSNGQPVQSSATHSNGACTADSSAAIANGSGYLTCDGASYSDANDGFVAYTDPSLTNNSNYENCTQMNGINLNSLTGCGYLYNWYTATAGSGNSAGGSTTARNVNSSICPAGWQLPKGAAISAQNEFAILNNAMATGTTTASTTNSATTRPNWRNNGAFEGSLAGYYTSSFSNAGNYGFYWSSSANAIATNAYYLNFNYSSVTPGHNSTNRYNGSSVRCML